MSVCKLDSQNRLMREDIRAFLTAYLESIRNIIENPEENNSFIIKLSNSRRLILQFVLDSDGQKWYTFEYESNNPREAGICSGDAYLDFEDCAEKIVFEYIHIVDCRICFI